MSQFVMSAYFLLGGAYTLKVGGHVRMDLVYDRLSVAEGPSPTLSPSWC